MKMKCMCMFQRRVGAIAAFVAGLITGAIQATPARSAKSLNCWMNDSRQTCQVKPWGKGGFEIRFSDSALYRFVRAGPPSTDNRRMWDQRGRLGLMSGHHNFTLSEQKGDGNRIVVSNVKSQPAAAVDHLLWMNRDSLLFLRDGE